MVAQVPPYVSIVIQERDFDTAELQRALFLFNHGGSYKTDTQTPDGYNVVP